ncbi:hypothetical protein EIL87_20285 [Saccharopolyspora rhizosphaerae]|uniref:Uncharacterized protein n=1 Tax=Saccharopolyspora rhizosphaerae TaxID=2492662 RepID=A0A3R8QJZ9_9PSEU|nr:hypothetical protein [Saccharopolyspora rhizosphaerae]RRO14101.1 hypothetical protein EIL87_20285 [Saccharopolyspora rhizosphaerae]
MKERYWTAGISWLVHALGMRQNPVRRRVDRLVAVALLGLLVVALTVVPLLALSSGKAEYVAQRREAAVMASSQHVVDAVVLTAPEMVGSSPGGGASVHADVGWTGGDGRSRAERAEVPSSSHVGSRVPVWVDGADRLAPTPPTEVTSIASATGTAVGVLALGLLACAGIMKTVRAVADGWARRRWEWEWVNVEPDWTGPGRG